MQTSAEIRAQIQQWAKTILLPNESASASTTGTNVAEQWVAGTMFLLIPNDSPHVIPAMALTKANSKLFGIAACNDFPHVFSIPVDDAQSPVKGTRLPIANVQALANRNGPLGFIKRTRGTNFTTKKIAELPQALTDTIFNDRGHPAVIHSRAKASKSLPTNDPTMQWLQTACVQAPNDPNHSLVHLPTTKEPLPLPKAISDIIEAEWKEARPDTATEVITALNSQSIIATGTHQPPAPRAHPIQDLTQSPDTEDTQGQRPNEHTQQRQPQLPKTVGFKPAPPPIQPPTTFPPANSTAQQPPTQYATPTVNGFYQPPGLAASPYQPTQIFPTPTHQPFQQWHSQESNDNVANSIVKQADKQLALLFEKPNLTADDWQRIKTCESIRSTYSVTSSSTESHNDHRIYHLLGWSGYSNIGQFHAATNNMWREILKINTNGPRETKVAHLIVHPLKKTYFELQDLLHHDWIKMIAAFEFAPELHGKGNKQGLGPLAYVTRTLRELQLVRHQREMMEAASAVSTGDVAKARLGAPIMPDRVHEVISIIQHQMNVIRFLFTPFCPLLGELQKVHQALQRNAASLSQTPDFQWSIAAELLWQLSSATKQFFDHTTGPTELQRNIRPYVNLSWLATAIATGTIQPSHTKPDLYLPPKRRDVPDRATPPKRQRSERGERADRTPRSRERTRPLTVNYERQLPPASQKLINTYLEDPTARLPPLYIARRKVDIDTLDSFANQLGATKGDCVRYNLYGKCTAPNCAHNHEHRDLSDNHAKLLAKVLSKGP